MDTSIGGASSQFASQCIEEETYKIQDENMSTLLEHFMQTFKLSEADTDIEEDYVEDEGFEEISGEDENEGFYINKLRSLVKRAKSNTKKNFTFYIYLSHINKWDPSDVEMSGIGKQLYNYIIKNYFRFHECLERRMSSSWLIKYCGDSSALNHSNKFHLQFLAKLPLVYTLRNIRCEMLGELICVRGQISRVSDVRPELQIAKFRCNECGNVSNFITQQFKYTMPTKCNFESCGNRIDWELLVEECIFGDWQKIRLQESVQESFSGAMPRSMDVIVRNAEADLVNAGDKVLITGCLIAVPNLPSLVKPGDLPKSVQRQMNQRNEQSFVTQGIQGIKSLGVRDLGYKLCLLATRIEQMNPSALPNNINDADTLDLVIHPETDIFNAPELSWITSIAKSKNTLQKLAECIAPRVFGNLELKKGILLMIVGGVSKKSKNSKFRGDINMCMVGDPSTAKSQFLKFVESFAPRAVFASGKGSTAAGLTAAVRRDPEQGDNMLEAGALMYADNGICCIDEFDKMEERDRVAIHEAMEQQTISIAKSGIHATLNARASVLAACNPKFGRYDRSKTFSQNVNIPSPLLSRFDLFFTLLDEVDKDYDTHVAKHLVKLHMMPEEDEDSSSQTILTNDELRVYIELAKKVKPYITDKARLKLVEFYVALRTSDIQPGSQRSIRITVRQLESLIRLSEAVARLKFSEYVTTDHVQEACDIFKASLQKVSCSRQVNLTEDIEENKDTDDEDKNNEQTANEDNAEGNNSSSSHISKKNLNKELSITNAEYERITSRFIEKIKEFEQNDQDALGLLSNELIEWYMDNFVTEENAEPLSADEIEMWFIILQRIIKRLVEQDRILLADPVSTPDGEEVFALRVHPNYAAYDFTFFDSSQKKFSHLDFGYKTFKEQNASIINPEENENSDMDIGGVTNNTANENFNDIDLPADANSLLFPEFDEEICNNMESQAYDSQSYDPDM